MRSDTFISELHDIGKLADKEALKKVCPGIKIKGHAFYDFDFTLFGIQKPSSPSWYLQYAEEDILNHADRDLLNSSEAIRLIPDPQIRADILLTKMADGISASITRQIHKGQAGEGVYKLWNPEYYQKKGKYWAAFKDIPSLRCMFQYIDSCVAYQNFLDDFKENLDLTPEDKSPPGNTVSLYTHLELSGKIFRVFKKHSELRLQNSQYVLINNGQAINSIKEACGHRDIDKEEGKWIFRLIFCHINFSQSLIRLQDLNVLKIREKQIRDFAKNENTKDYILFFTNDFMCLFIPKNEELSITKLMRPFVEKGLILDYIEMEADLNLLTSSFERAYRLFHSLPQTSRHLKVYEKTLNGELPPELGPDICDSCQIREGKERMKGQVRECLCPVCTETRDMGEPAVEYAKWEGKAAWMKITLEQDQIEKLLRRLFEEYVNDSPMMRGVQSYCKTELKECFRPLAVRIDFIKDYKTLLRLFKEKIYTLKNKTGDLIFNKETFLYPIDEFDEFGIFKVDSGKIILAVIDTFFDCMNQIFPKCTNDNSPIRLAISFASVKYPYQKHWRFLSKPMGLVDIQQQPSGRLTLKASQYKSLKEGIGEPKANFNHFLHRLKQIKASLNEETMIQLEVYERNNRRKFPILLEFLKEGLTPEQILNFYELTMEEEF